jgi:hypothetical protein
MDAVSKLWQAFQRQSQGKKNVIAISGMIATLYAINKLTQTRKRPEKTEVRFSTLPDQFWRSPCNIGAKTVDDIVHA